MWFIYLVLIVIACHLIVGFASGHLHSFLMTFYVVSLTLIISVPVGLIFGERVGIIAGWAVGAILAIFAVGFGQSERHNRGSQRAKGEERIRR